MTILKRGQNCRRKDHVGRVAYLIDGGRPINSGWAFSIVIFELNWWAIWTAFFKAMKARSFKSVGQRICLNMRHLLSAVATLSRLIIVFPDQLFQRRAKLKRLPFPFRYVISGHHSWWHGHPVRSIKSWDSSQLSQKRHFGNMSDDIYNIFSLCKASVSLAVSQFDVRLR